MTTPVYKKCKKVYFAVTKNQIGYMPKDTAILGISGTDRKKVATKLFDWCMNEYVSLRDVKLVSGYIFDSITNYEVYA